MSVGRSTENGTLTDEEIRDIVFEGADELGADGQRVVVLIPDLTRSGPLPLLFRCLCDALAKRVKTLDFMIALGTHHELDGAAIAKLVGMNATERQAHYDNVRVLNHEWSRPDAMVNIGTLARAQIAEATNGMLDEDIPVPLNRRVAEDYDRILICGPVFPHEVAGFSGGNKYLFPGVSGQKFLNFFHWLGALITLPKIIGNAMTPVRAFIDRAAAMVPVPIHAFCYVVDGAGLAGLFFGATEDAWARAVDVSRPRHIKYVDRPFRRVLARAPTMYEDLWVGGKCMYKLECALEDDAELIIYAPHIREVSISHGELLEQIGYHTRDYFVRDWERYRHLPWGIVAHSTHVRGIGHMDGALEKPRVSVTLATGISKARCERIGLGYLDPTTIDVKDFEGREAEGVLYVPKAGEILYRLKDPPTWQRGQDQ